MVKDKERQRQYDRNRRAARPELRAYYNARRRCTNPKVRFLERV